MTFCAPLIDARPWAAALAAALPEARVWPWSAERAAEQADYAVVWTPDAAFFHGQRQLRAVFNMGAGVDRVLQLGTLPRDVPLMRLRDAGKAHQMAEYVCHALIGHTRRFDDYAAQRRARVWAMLPREKRAAFPVGVMGLGAIGAAVARAVAGFGYPTLGWSRSAKTLDGITTYAGDAELDAFLRATRVLVCVLPLTAATEGILNASTLGRLRPGGVLINVGRSQHLVDADLCALLASGRMAGATLDVFRSEPLAADHPFWDDPRIVLTPHIAADTAMAESVAQIAGDIRAFERGEPPAGRVDLDRGY